MGAGVFEVVVADETDIRDRQWCDEPEVVLMAFWCAGSGEVAEVGQKDRGRAELSGLTSSWAKMASAVGSGHAPLPPTIKNENG